MDPDRASDDDSLIRRSLAGEVAAFRIIVERYGDRVLRFCRARLGRDEDADDAAQEVFLRAFRSLGSYRPGESFPSWLFAVAANRVRTRKARGAVEALRLVRAASEAAAAGQGGEDPAFLAQKEAEREALRCAVAALPPGLRACVELHYFAELGVADCARVLGLGEEAVKSRLFRARKALRNRLESRQPEGLRGGNPG